MGDGVSDSADLMTSQTDAKLPHPDAARELEPEALEHFRRALGFVPSVVAAQSLTPHLVEADRCFGAVVASAGRLSPIQQELLQLAVAVSHENQYETALSAHALIRGGFRRDRLSRFIFDYREADLSPVDIALLEFSLTLARHPTRITFDDVEELRSVGIDDECIVEIGYVTAWSNYRCVKATGLGVEPDVEPPWIPPSSMRRTCFRSPPNSAETNPTGRRPFVEAPPLGPESLPLFAELQSRDGAVPNVLRAQTSRPDLILAQSAALERILLTEGALCRLRKEHIFVAVSAANLSVYCVAAHDAVLRSMGLPSDQCEQIAVDHRHADLSDADHALLDAMLDVVGRPSGPRRTPVSLLEQHGFSASEIVEAVSVAAAAYFTNTISTALGPEPDFPSPPALERRMHPFPARLHQSASERSPGETADPDAESVSKVKHGDTDAFEDLVRRHGKRVHRTLGGILRDVGDVEDAVQETFIKAYRNISQFEGRSLFSTWLTRVAVNVGLQNLRRRKNIESLDEDPQKIERFQPNRLQPWQDNPERLYSRSEMRNLVLKAVDDLPPKYRTAVLLRDFQQLSTQEAAEALGISVTALKARLFRGRLLLRESLTPYYARRDT